MTEKKIKEKIAHYEKMLATKENKNELEDFKNTFHPVDINWLNLYTDHYSFKTGNEINDDEKLLLLQQTLIEYIQSELPPVRQDVKDEMDKIKIKDFMLKYPGLTENWD